MQDKKNEFLTVTELMDYLRIQDKKTAYKLINGGEFPVYRLSERKTLIKRSDIEKYIETHRIF